MLSRTRRVRLIAGAAGLVIALLVGWRLLRLPRPPSPDVVATFAGGQVAKQELRRYLHEFLPRPAKGGTCKEHGRDHDLCGSSDSCETFTDCGKEHGEFHSLSAYRQAAVSLVVDKLLERLAAERKLGERKNARHLMKHVTEDVNVADLHQDWHRDKIRVEESEIREYYDQNRDKFGESSLADMSEQIKSVLVSRKEGAFQEEYLKALRQESGLTVNYDLLKFPEPDDGQLRVAYMERQEEFRLPARVKLLLIEVPGNKALAQEGRSLLIDGKREVDGRTTLDGRQPGVKVTQTDWLSEKDALWGQMALGRLGPGEVTGVCDNGGKYLAARVEAREEPKVQEFKDARKALIPRVAQELRDRHLRDNANSTLFSVHGEPYSLGEFMEEFRELPALLQARYGTFEGRKRLADKMAERALVVESASDDGRTGKNRKRLDRARLEVLKQVLHQEEIDDKITMTDDELRGSYDKHKAAYCQPPRVKINLLCVPAGGDETGRLKAENALTELKALSPEELADKGFAQIVKRYSDDADLVKSGGRVEAWISESDDIVNEWVYHELHRKLLKLKRNELSEAFRLRDAFYIVFVRDREEARDRPFEEVKPLVSEDLRDQKHRQLLQSLEMDLFRRSGAKIYDYTLLEMLKEEGRGLW